MNSTAALLACHDKLATALLLGRERIPHPLTAVVDRESKRPTFDWPVVVKPRFGSWGQGVKLLRDARSFERHLRDICREPWFVRHGALVQEFVPANASDLRLVIVGGEVLGAIRRVARPGEWRTNISLGARRQMVVPSQEARAIALAAVRTVGIDLAGVDLLRRPDGSYVVLELNGAVDFTQDYSLGATNVFNRAARRLLALAAAAEPPLRIGAAGF